MRQAALCIIGSELVRGIIQDRHAKTLASDLTRLGYRVQEITIVPDDGSIVEVLDRLVSNVDLIITTGGLGPTSDDITRDAIARIYEVPLVLDPAARETLFEIVGDRLNEANLRQVMIPEGFTVIPNTQGTAPGFCRSGEIYTLPGPPKEMLAMWHGAILPDLIRLLGDGTLEERLELSVFLTPESQLEEACALAVQMTSAQFDQPLSQMPLWGTRVQLYRISLYLQGSTAVLREQVFHTLEGLLGPSRVREGDRELVDDLYLQLQQKGLTVAGAESCTGGLAAKLLTDRPGSSQHIWGSMVTYAYEAKERVLKVSHETLEQEGAVSASCVDQMAEGVLRLSGCDVSFSISGIAGPSGGSEQKPVGTVWFAFASPEHGTQHVCLSFRPFSRDSVRRRAAVSAILLLEQYIIGENLLDIVSQWQYI
ncbi:MAG: nicotinamide-nucleotide amidohydrolase family protein [Spirochaetia bacterium]|nr:nicotinamide-nucleotide amidohydrolase family protein [Spirochaetia bacterium]MCF7942666.1 nicotinamide-nucleotide amidohydrolase family protein [Spirochaetia bacterium]